jgi:hypothetical protein
MDLPDFVKTYFWGDDLNDLNLEQHARYIAQVILEMGDSDAVNWLFEALPKSQIIAWLPGMHLSAKSANYWRIMLT